MGRSRRLEASSSIGALRAAAALGLITGACGAPAKPEPTVANTVQSAPAPAPPALLARWIQGGGRTSVADELPTGAVLLAGGRRAVVAPDGRVVLETAPSPEPLVELRRVPVADGGSVLVGRGRHGLYRFDDPLGQPIPLGRFEAPIWRIGTLPSTVAVWHLGGMMGDVADSLDGGRGSRPTLIDVNTGRVAEISRVPVLPMWDVAFRDEQRGVAWFDIAYLAVTRDGGATWKAVKDDEKNHSLISQQTLRALLGEGPAAPLPLPVEDAPTMRWVRRAHRDPLMSAVETGVLATPTSALVVVNGLVARVDLASGVVTESVDVARGRKPEDCSLARSSDTVFIACRVMPEGASERGEADARELQVTTLPLTGKLADAWAPQLKLPARGSLRSSASGGVAVMLEGTDNPELGGAWVLTPGTGWARVTIGAHGEAAPLRDGRLAFVRGASPSKELGGPAVVLASASDQIALAPLPLPAEALEPDGSVFVDGAIDEDESGRLHFAIRGEHDTFLVTQPRAGVATVRHVAGVTRAIVRASHGVATGPRGVEVTDDWGERWQTVETPGVVQEPIDMNGDKRDWLLPVVVSEVGASVSTTEMDGDRGYPISHLRVGWGAAQSPVPPTPTVATVDVPRAPRQGAKQPRLACRSAPGRPSGPALFGAEDDIHALLVPKAARRPGRTTTLVKQRDFPLGAAGALDEDPGADPAASKATWSFRWIDPLELGSKVRSMSGAAPAVALRGVKLEMMAASGASALFVVRAESGRGTLRFAVRPRQGRFDAVELPQGLVPENAIDIKPGDDGRVIAWRARAGLVAWPLGEAPRVIAAVHDGRVGAPGSAGVPLLGSGVTRFFPIVPPAATGHEPPTPIADWLRAPNDPSEQGPTPCKPGSAGGRFSIGGWRTRVKLDGAPLMVRDTTYAFEVGTSRCAAKVAVTFSDPAENKTPPADHGRPPLVFLRVDLTTGLAEGGFRTGKSVTVGKIACEIDRSPRED